jgi:hypothetical protein
VRQDEDGTMVEAQAKEGSVERIAVGELGEGIVGFRHVDRFDVDVEARPPRAPLLVRAGANEQPVHPGIEGDGVAQTPEVTPGSDERVLHGIFRGIPIAEDPPRDRVQAVVCGGREGIESLVVAPLCAFDEFGRQADPLDPVRRSAALTH